ncbi:MAG: hypothetical protein WEB37_03370 [Bacteroidota bacterium]
MKNVLLITMVVGALVLCSHNGQAQNRNQSRQTVSFGVNPGGFLNSNSPQWQKTITVAPLTADSKPSKAISLRSLIPLQSTKRNEIPLGEISSKLASRKLLVTISD